MAPKIWICQQLQNHRETCWTWAPWENFRCSRVSLQSPLQGPLLRLAGECLARFRLAVEEWYQTEQCWYLGAGQLDMKYMKHHETICFLMAPGAKKSLQTPNRSNLAGRKTSQQLILLRQRSLHWPWPECHRHFEGNPKQIRTVIQSSQ